MKDYEVAFNAAKARLLSSNLLVHYDPTLPVRMAGDASPYGIGAVLSHVMPNGVEQLIVFASRTLSTSQSNYAQLEKEALTLIFGVRKFYTYLYGRPFTLVTDNKPLQCILGPKKGIPLMAAAHLQRWAIILASYQYDIEFKRPKPMLTPMDSQDFLCLPPLQQAYLTLKYSTSHKLKLYQ